MEEMMTIFLYPCKWYLSILWIFKDKSKTRMIILISLLPLKTNLVPKSRIRKSHGYMYCQLYNSLSCACMRDHCGCGTCTQCRTPLYRDRVTMDRLLSGSFSEMTVHVGRRGTECLPHNVTTAMYLTCVGCQVGMGPWVCSVAVNSFSVEGRRATVKC